jgi:hypothetical protein
MAKKKKMTQREKKLQAETRAELREKGLIPPIKQRLNRKKFAKEVLDEFKEFNSIGDIIYLYRAVSCMAPSTGYINKVTPEEVGALKVMKLAMEWKKFEHQKREQSDGSYKIKELFEEVIEPIKSL